MTPDGAHGLSCRQGPDRITTHAALSGIIWHALQNEYAAQEGPYWIDSLRRQTCRRPNANPVGERKMLNLGRCTHRHPSRIIQSLGRSISRRPIRNSRHKKARRERASNSTNMETSRLPQLISMTIQRYSLSWHFLGISTDLSSIRGRQYTILLSISKMFTVTQRKKTTSGLSFHS